MIRDASVMSGAWPILSTEDAVAHIKNSDMILFSGFIPAGSAKAVPEGLAERVRE
jgi:acyl-CoA hydrolase